MTLHIFIPNQIRALKWEAGFQSYSDQQYFTLLWVVAIKLKTELQNTSPKPKVEDKIAYSKHKDHLRIKLLIHEYWPTFACNKKRELFEKIETGAAPRGFEDFFSSSANTKELNHGL